MKAGAARRDITPELGTKLMGYPETRVSTGVHDRLNVTALALESGGVKTVILSITTTIIDDAEHRRIREAVSAATGLPGERVTACAWQIHTGPATADCAGWNDRDDAFCRGVLEGACAGAAAEALADMREALTGVEEIDSDVGVNRRQVTLEGDVVLGQNKFGPYDRTMTAVRLIGAADKRPIANIVHYGAHPTAAGAACEITRDWPGVMVDNVEGAFGGLTLFLNGAVGDVGPRLTNGHTTGDMRLMRQIGERAATDAVSAFRKIKSYGSREMELIVGDIHLKYRPLDTPAHARAALAASEAGKDKPGLGKAEHIYWQWVMDEHEKGCIKTEKIIRQTITRIGDIVIIPFTGEPFAEITLRLREHSRFRHTLCVSTANGNDGYFPSRDSLHRGGYEVLVAKAFSPYILAEDIDDILIRENLRLLETASE